MARRNSNIDRTFGALPRNEKICIFKYTGEQRYTTVVATGRLTSLEELREDFPNDNIQPCQEDQIEYYKTTSVEGPRLFVYQHDGSKEKVYYWRDGHWYGYKTLESVEFPTTQTVDDDDIRVTTAQSPADDRWH